MVRLAGQSPPGIGFVSASPSVGYRCPLAWLAFKECWDLKSGPPAYMVSTLPTESSIFPALLLGFLNFFSILRLINFKVTSRFIIVSLY